MQRLGRRDSCLKRAIYDSFRLAGGRIEVREKMWRAPKCHWLYSFRASTRRGCSQWHPSLRMLKHASQEPPVLPTCLLT
jgi:hypothetical protein